MLWAHPEKLEGVLDDVLLVGLAAAGLLKNWCSLTKRKNVELQSYQQCPSAQKRLRLPA